jgi:hypothetical protein
LKLGEAAAGVVLWPKPVEPFVLAAGAPNVKPLLAGAALLAGSEAFAAPKPPPNGLPAGVVEPDD